MWVKKLLYLSDLYNYYVSQNKNVKFSSKDNDTTIVVHIDEPFTFEKNDDDDLNLYCPIRLCHTKKNVNQSYISEKAMKNAIDTAYEMPILGYIYPDPDNEEQFTFAGHEFYINDDSEIVYEEAPVGVVSSKEKLQLVYDKDADKTYLDGLGKIWRTYTKAAEILEREKKFSVSVELCVDELSYDSKEKVLVIDAFRFSGVTILGKNRDTGDEIKPGMQGANISLADFSEKNNSIFSHNKQLIELLSELNKKLDSFNDINNSRKEDARMKKDFEEEAETSEVKVDESTEDTPDEKADFEETPQKKKSEDDDSAILIDKDDESDDDDDDQQDDNDSDDQQDDDDSEDETEEPTEPEVTETQSAEDNGTDADDPEDVNYYSIDYTVNVNGEKKEFSVSLKEKLNTLTTLVNDTYGELDGAWFDCDVIEDSKIVEFHDWWANKHYRQSYSVKKDVYSLVGDRVETFMLFATADEKKQLEQMKANYSSIEEKLQQYEAEPEKLEVFANTDYDQIRETEAFKELSKRESYFAMSKEEIAEKLDGLLLEFAKNHKIEFSADAEQKKSVGMKLFGNPSKKSTGTKSRYGGIFSK